LAISSCSYTVFSTCRLTFAVPSLFETLVHSGGTKSRIGMPSSSASEYPSACLNALVGRR